MATAASDPETSATSLVPGSSASQRVPLLDEEGELSPAFEDALSYIFQKYSSISLSPEPATASTSTPPTGTPSASSSSLAPHSPRKPQPELGSRPPKGAVMTDVALDRFAYDTNGQPFDKDSKEELKTFLDCDDNGSLTWSGFIQMYHLQADNDVEETWKDLSTHGFQSNLELVSTRREGEEKGAGEVTAPKEEEESKSEKADQDDTTKSTSKTGKQDVALTEASHADPDTTLLTQLHIQHILRLSSKTTSLSYHLTTHLRLNGVYWGLAALELMSPGSSLLPAQDLVDFVQSCYDASSGGFGSFPGHDAHVLSTCSAVQVLAIKARLEDLPDREATVAFILSLFNPVTGLLYGDRSRLEEDNRFLYCAVNALAHLSALDRLDKERAVQGVLSCVNFDGGFGRVQGAESHAAQAFTCLGILSILSSLDRLPYQGQRAAAWLSERQLPGGGLNGRPQKLEDVCYSWWVLSSLSILKKLDWIDGEKLRRFILSAQDPDLGGIADRPGNVSDVYHTFFGCAGLSLLGYEGLQPIDPVYAMPQRVVRELGIERPYQRAPAKSSS